MKRLLFCGLLLMVACNSRPEKIYDLVIRNVNLIDGTGDGIKSNATVLINDGVILSVDGSEKSSGKKIVDGKGKYLIPGLYDCHVHTSDFKSDLPKLIHFGVTSVLIPGGSKCSNEYFKILREFGENANKSSPTVYHTSQHLITKGSHPVRTYPSSNWVEGETYFELKDTTQIESIVKEAVKYPIKGIKLTIEEGPMPPPIPRMPQSFINKVVREAHKNNTEVYAHISDNIELKMALEAGIGNFLHFTGIDLDFVEDSTLVNTIYDSKISWVTTLMIDKSFLYPLHPEWIDGTPISKLYTIDEIGDFKSPIEIEKAKQYLDFFIEEYGLQNPDLQKIISLQVEDLIVLLDHGVNLVLGTDAGNTYNFHGYSLHEEMQLLEIGGMKPLDIIKMGTHNAALMLGELEKSGTLEKGKFADMVVLNQNPLESISHTLDIDQVYKKGVLQKRLD